ncbi:unnamed protein product [Brassica oleracea]
MSSAQVQIAFKNLFDYPDLHNEIFKTSANLVAMENALSKTRGRRYQTYIAHGGPRWLSSLI